MVAAITVKLSRGGGRSSRDDVIGGATLSFDICEGHPYEEEVYGLLHSVRAQVNDLWTKVSEGNKENPIQDDLKTKVTFYFGQTVQGVGFEEEEE
jgi:hypothetical protein